MEGSAGRGYASDEIARAKWQSRYAAGWPLLLWALRRPDVFGWARQVRMRGVPRSWRVRLLLGEVAAPAHGRCHQNPRASPTWLTRAAGVRDPTGTRSPAKVGSGQLSGAEETGHARPPNRTCCCPYVDCGRFFGPRPGAAATRP